MLKETKSYSRMKNLVVNGVSDSKRHDISKPQKSCCKKLNQYSSCHISYT